jgi:hypothetical protein
VAGSDSSKGREDSVGHHPTLLVGMGAVASNLNRASAEIVRLWWETEGATRSTRRYRELRARTDLLLDYLERMNMRYPQGRKLDRRARQTIQRVLAELPEPARASFPSCGTVQEALDAVFELKKELRRQLLPDVLPALCSWEPGEE